MKIFAIDPSGSFNEGRGQTGWVYTENNKVLSFGLIKAVDYNSREEYWKAHSDLLLSFLEKDKDIHIVMENFRLYANKASAQINSEMETIRLIGYLEMIIFEMDKIIHFQMASQVKNRFNDEILVRQKIITKDQNGRQYINGINVAGHVIDALRHACLFYFINRK